MLQREYNSKDESSEECSIAITRCTHINSKTSIDFQTELMMIDDPTKEDFYGLKCYNCHLMSQADHPEDKDNNNNSLWMSWPTYLRFNGLHTIYEHRITQFAILNEDPMNSDAWLYREGKSWHNRGMCR